MPAAADMVLAANAVSNAIIDGLGRDALVAAPLDCRKKRIGIMGSSFSCGIKAGTGELRFKHQRPCNLLGRQARKLVRRRSPAGRAPAPSSRSAMRARACISGW